MKRLKMNDTKVVALLCSIAFAIFYLPIFYFGGRAILNLAYNLLWLKFKGISSGECDTACTLSFFPPGFLIAGLSVLFFISFAFFFLVLYLFWKGYRNEEESEGVVGIS